MTTELIPLRCPSCGSKLDVHDDMERFACGYCGSELVAQRRGGTVALKAVTDAIERVQRGTDRTAQELKLSRLKKERDELRERREKRTLPNYSGAWGGIGVLGFFAVLALVMTFTGLPGCFFVALGCAAGVVFGSVAIVNRKTERGRLTEEIRSLEDRIRGIENGLGG